MRDVECIERVGDLAHDLVAVAKDSDAIAAGGGAGDDARKQDSLSASGRRLVEHAGRPNGVLGADAFDVRLLVWSQHRQRHGAPPSRTMSSARPSGVDGRPCTSLPTTSRQ